MCDMGVLRAYLGLRGMKREAAGKECIMRDCIIFNYTSLNRPTVRIVKSRME